MWKKIMDQDSALALTNKINPDLIISLKNISFNVLLGYDIKKIDPFDVLSEKAILSLDNVKWHLETNQKKMEHLIRIIWLAKIDQDNYKVYLKKSLVKKSVGFLFKNLSSKVETKIFFSPR